MSKLQKSIAIWVIAGTVFVLVGLAIGYSMSSGPDSDTLQSCRDLANLDDEIFTTVGQNMQDYEFERASGYLDAVTQDRHDLYDACMAE